MNSQQELLDAINTISQSREKSCDTPAIVLRVEDDTVWVHIDGGADETPVQKTINCAEGETVQVRISNGSAFLVGNASAPPTDDKTANEAHFVAEQADEKASEAIKSVGVIEQTVEGKVDTGDSNITSLSSTLYQNANGVNVFNDTLAVGDSYAHIDGNSFDIKQATSAGTIDDTNDAMVASFGREVTIGTRGLGTVGQYSQVFGEGCDASGGYAHAEGFGTSASGNYSHSEGHYTYAKGHVCHTEGQYTEANGNAAHAEGDSTKANGHYSHAEGGSSKATGDYSHAEGGNTEAVGQESHAEGGYSYASGAYSHAEGRYTKAQGGYRMGLAAHAEGYYSTASGNASHAEGGNTEATGDNSHAEGGGTIASGDSSHAQNINTIAASYAQTAIGKYNISDDNDVYAFILGNGTSDNSRSDAMRIDWNGNVQITGEVQSLNGSRKYIAEPSSEGTSGQVLATDGNGGRMWTSAGGGGMSVTVSGENLIFFSGAYVSGENLIIS